METRTNSRIGRSIFGGSPAMLVIGSVLIGLALSAAAGGLAEYLQAGERPLLSFWVVSGATLPISSILGWVLLVDRSSIKGAPRNPEQSVEQIWFSQAAIGALFTTIALTGILCLVFTVWPQTIDASLASGVVAGWLMLTFVISYAVNSRRGR